MIFIMIMMNPFHGTKIDRTFCPLAATDVKCVLVSILEETLYVTPCSICGKILENR